MLERIQKCDQGAAAIEYGLIAALIAVAATVGMTSLGNSLNNQFTNAVKKLNKT